MSKIVRLRITRPHTQTSRLMARLQAFAARTEEKCPADGLTAVLRRIDTTILPRALTITTEAGDSLRLLVSNRRLMRVEHVGQPMSGGDAPADPGEAAEQFAARLEPVLRDAKLASIGTTRYHSDAMFWDVGCGAGRLASTMGVLAQEPSKQPANGDLERLLSEHAMARAEVTTTGQVLSRVANPEAEAVLTDLLDWANDQVVAASALARAREECICLPISDAHDAVILQRHDGYTLAVLSTTLRDWIIGAWQARPPGTRLH